MHSCKTHANLAKFQERSKGMIEIQGVTKHFDSNTAVQNLSLRIGDGDRVGVFGANGAGKSTLLRMLAGVLLPDAGEITVDGAHPGKAFAAREAMFFLPDEQYFAQGETVKETAGYYARFYLGFDTELFAKLCEQFELKPSAKIGKLSKGVKKQLMMLIAISVRPRYILLDEVFDGIDSVSKQTLKSALMRLSAEYGTTVVTASHNILEIEDFCTSVCLLYKSNLVLFQNINELKSSRPDNGGLVDILTKELEALGYAGKNIDFI